MSCSPKICKLCQELWTRSRSWSPELVIRL
ncbi:unnamed protein product [Nippostrongylus brasiliensis]|uniref:Uncharacterized protein n=1 Tax=Nippostrongylus brasiliensis TaxID=27835 RepID=A0A0N4XRP2_NIPBR|nr:unnamed protein product [Nippostrongylus brasiliensis]